MAKHVKIFCILLILSCLLGCAVSQTIEGVVVPPLKVLEGIPANLTDIHYQVSVQYRPLSNRSTTYHICGGAIINLWNVITAAHCMYLRTASGGFIKLIPSEVAVQSATTILGLDSGGQKRDVQNITLHKDYLYSYGFDNDIALLELQSNFIITGSLSPIDMRFSSTSENELCTISGFGFINNISETPILIRSTLPIANFKLCQEIYKDDDVTGNMICAGEKGKGVCLGDSGGPMVCKGKLVGIASFGPTFCQTPLYPGVYTEIAKYEIWIKTGAAVSIKASLGIIILMCLISNFLL